MDGLMCVLCRELEVLIDLEVFLLAGLPWVWSMLEVAASVLFFSHLVLLASQAETNSQIFRVFLTITLTC